MASQPLPSQPIQALACEACDSTGWNESGFYQRKCSACNGSGRLDEACCESCLQWVSLLAREDLDPHFCVRVRVEDRNGVYVEAAGFYLCPTCRTDEYLHTTKCRKAAA